LMRMVKLRCFTVDKHFAAQKDASARPITGFRHWTSMPPAEPARP